MSKKFAYRLLYLIFIFRFPKNGDVCSKWKTFCRLNDNDNVSTLRICSGHFTSSDYMDPNMTSSRYLIKGAVPSIRKPAKPENPEVPGNVIAINR